nr:hypothetical protein [Microctonus hyperodae filamentous virus]
MAAAAKEFATVSKLFARLQDYYRSSGRTEDFVKALYNNDANLLKFYQSCQMPARNIIITSNIHHVPLQYKKFFQQNDVIILIVYFDDIQYYKKVVWKKKYIGDGNVCSRCINK